MSPPADVGRSDIFASQFEFDAELWLYDGDAAWHFITVPQDISDEIDERTVGQKAGFGSVPVHVTVGVTTWSTSLFPDSKRSAYILPVKKDVRRAESIEAGSQVSVRLELAATAKSG